MDTSQNLKRIRDNGEYQAKKICVSKAKTTSKPQQDPPPQEQHPNQQISQPQETHLQTHPTHPQMHPPPPQNHQTHSTSPQPAPPEPFHSLSLSPLSLSLLQHYLTILKPEHNRRTDCNAVQLKTLKTGTEHNRSSQQKLRTPYREQWFCVLRFWGPFWISSSGRHSSHCWT